MSSMPSALQAVPACRVRTRAGAHPLATTLAMACGFVVRYRGKHVYNSGSRGIALPAGLLPGASMSAGRVVSLCGPAAPRTARSDVAPVCTSCTLGAGRSGAPVGCHGRAAPMSSGELPLFTSFPIAEPMTFRDRRVAANAHVAPWGFAVRFTPRAPVPALFVAVPLVALPDRGYPGTRFACRRSRRPATARCA